MCWSGAAVIFDLGLADISPSASSSQLVEVHALLRSEETTEEPRTMDALRFVEDSGGQYLSFIHQFFQCGCDRRYHHVSLSGRSMALSRIPSCEMVDYLRSNQW